MNSIKKSRKKFRPNLQIAGWCFKQTFGDVILKHSLIMCISLFTVRFNTLNIFCNIQKNI